MAEYYMILTDAGHAAYAQAGAAHGPVQISAVAVGDGGGVAVQPAQSWTALVHEVWRSAPALVQVVADNPRLVLVEAHVPYNVGGWFVREVGLLSPEGVLLAVGNHPESYKPALESGAGKELMLRLYLEHSNAKETTLKINPDIVMASCSYVLNTVTTHDASPTAHAGQLAGMNDHVADKANPHQVTAAQAGAEPAGAVAAHDISPTAHASQFAGVAGHMADLANPHQVTAAQAGAEPQGAVAGHNESGTAHADIRADIAGINIPAASETVAGIIKQATTAQALAGVDNTTAMSPADVAAAIAALPAPAVVTGVARNLAMSATGLSALVSVTADELVVKDGAGNAKLLSTLALSASTAVMGAGGLDTGAIAGSTWYAVWVIAKADDTAAILLSLSATAPTLPAGYSYMARVGWTRTDATANKYPRAMRQHGRRVQYIVAAGTNVTALPSLASGVAGNVVTPVYVAVAVGEAVPPTAKVIFLGLYCNSAQACAQAAPNPNYGNYISTTSPPPITQYPANAAGEAVAVSSLMLESSNIYWASNAPVTNLFCSGWEE